MDVVLLFFLVLVFSVRFPAVQSALANQFTSYFLKDCPSSITIKYLDTDFYESIRLRSINIDDNNGNSLIEADEVWVDVKSLLELRNKISISSVELINPRFSITKQLGEKENTFTKFINCFPKSGKKEPVDFEIGTIKISNGAFSFIDENYQDSVSLGAVDFKNIYLTDVNTSISKFQMKNNVISSQSNKVSFNEKSGFKVETLNVSNLKIHSNEISGDYVKLNALSSILNLKHLKFSFNQYSNFSSFNDSVIISSNILTSKLEINNLKYFHSKFDNINETYNIKGVFEGKVRDMSLTNAMLSKESGDMLSYTGNATIKGLPDVENSFFYFAANELKVSKNSIENLELLKLSSVGELSLPDNLKLLGDVSAKGEFRGYLQGFMSNFVIETDLGKLSTDLNFYYDEFENKVVYDGEIKTPAFNIGKLYSLNKIGNVSGGAKINAQGLTIESLRTEIEADFKSFEVNKYNYQNIDVQGVFEKDLFSGTAKILDNNLNAEYEGDINFADKIPHYAFNLLVSKVNLKPLNLSKEDGQLSFKVKVDGTGGSIDDLKGDFLIKDISLTKDNSIYNIDSIQLISNSKLNQKNMKFKSSILDAYLSGNFELSQLPNVFKNLLHNVLPTKVNEDYSELPKNQNLDFNFELKDVSSFTNIFLPDLKISPGAIFAGDYSSNFGYFNFNSTIDYLAYKDFRINGVNLYTNLSEIYELELHIDSITNFDVVVPNISAFAAIFDDNIGLQLKWNGNSLNGEVGGNGYWNELGKFKFDLDKANISTLQQDWKLLSKSTITQIDTLKYQISDFELYNNSQRIKIEGVLGDKKSDVLSVNLLDLKLEDVIPIKSIDIKGDLILEGTIASVFNKPKVSGFLKSNITLEGSEFGEIYLYTKKRKTNNQIKIGGNFKQNNVDVMSVNGHYALENELSPFNFNFNFKNFNIAPVYPFLPSTIQNFAAEINGSISLSGTLENPELSGELEVDKGNVKITELNTEYSFGGKLIVEPDNIYSENFNAFDQYGTKANILSASFYHNNFKDYSYNFSVHMPKPFLGLNTTIKHNELFYGTAFATGFVNISFDKYNLLEIDVDARSEKYTEITLPLYGADEVSIGDFISFVKFSDTTVKEKNEVNLSGITMNFLFEATPEAKFNLVFDDVVGDKITAYGSGNISMEIDQYDQFKMYGQYVLDRGDYLFTLKNLINKKFSLVKGGTLSWYGDPYNSEIDLDAVYELKASVADLFPTEEKSAHKAKLLVKSHMYLTNNLFSPSIDFGISIPNASDDVKSVVASTINTKEELNRQFFSLLLLNKFLPRANSSIGNNLGSGVSSTTSEMLSNQVSQVLNQWWEDVDVGVNYNSGDQDSNEEYAVALSTQLFNEKLTFSGNFGVSQNSNETDNNNLIGDVLVEYIIDEKGTLRLRAFNQSNTFDPSRNYQGNYTQGIGLNYQKSFNTLDELLFWEKLKNIIKTK